MDPAVAWFQEEQNGPAKRIWLQIWETNLEMDQQQQQLAVNNNSIDNNNQKTTSSKDINMIVDNNNSSSNNNGQTERTYYNPSRRKPNASSTLDTNKASTFNMNRYQMKLVGKHGGCPWRPVCYPYKRGVVG